MTLRMKQKGVDKAGFPPIGKIREFREHFEDSQGNQGKMRFSAKIREKNFK